MNLLTDRVLRVRTSSGLVRMSLPGLLAAYGRDEVESLPGLQRHQAEAVHVFLCYLAGAVLARRGDADPAMEEAYWHAGLSELAQGREDWAWSLVVEDPSKPAFLQPPLPGVDVERLPVKAVTPDQLDLLQTAKNHDLKSSRSIHPHPDQWVYALISLQSMAGYSGKGNYGVSRMNSGYGNRAVVEIVHRRRPGGRWCDAVQRLLVHRREVLNGPWEYNPEGLVLVWLRPWDGRTSLALRELDPFYLEICRRIRLRRLENGAVAAHGANADQQRIAAGELKGNVGDAWLPVDLGKKDPAALTVGPSGITADLLRRLIFEDGLSLTPLQKPLAGVSGRVWLAVSVLVRGEGKTDGFREEWVIVPPEVRHRLFEQPVLRDPLAAIAKNAVASAGILRNRVLKPAVCSYLQGAPGQLKLDRKSTQEWWQRTQQRYETLWNDNYFDWLWSLPEDVDPDEALRTWAVRLKQYARTAFEEAMKAMPVRSGRRYRIRTLADRMFWGALYKHFPMLKEDRHDDVIVRFGGPT